MTRGVLETKEQARLTYTQSIAAGHGAQLLEQARADVFVMSVGNLRPKQTCTVSLT